jgi:secreted Zn-dependent insulinase-like peptidase
MKFQEKNKPTYEFVLDTATKMLHLENDEVKYFKYSKYLPQYNELIVNQLYEQLIPENSVIIVGKSSRFDIKALTSFSILPDFEKIFDTTGMNTTYYSINYNWKEVPEDRMKDLDNEREEFKNKIKLPLNHTNKFISNLTQLVSNDTAKEGSHTVLPTKIGDIAYKEQEFVTIYHKKDRSFKLPKIQIMINTVHSYLRVVKSNDDHQIYLAYLLSLFQSLEINFSEAISAGLSLELKNEKVGSIISITTYSDLLDVVNEVLYENLFNKTISNTNLNYFRELLEAEKQKWQFEQPYIRGDSYFEIIKQWSIPNKYNFTEFILTETELNKISPEKIMFTALYYGNIEETTVK